MMREWSDKDSEPLGFWDHALGAIVIVGSMVSIVTVVISIAALCIRLAG
jgi:hypothetical protein